MVNLYLQARRCTSRTRWRTSPREGGPPTGPDGEPLPPGEGGPPIGPDGEPLEPRYFGPGGAQLDQTENLYLQGRRTPIGPDGEPLAPGDFGPGGPSPEQDAAARS